MKENAKEKDTGFELINIKVIYTSTKQRNICQTGNKYAINTVDEWIVSLIYNEP